AGSTRTNSRLGQCSGMTLKRLRLRGCETRPMPEDVDGLLAAIAHRPPADPGAVKSLVEQAGVELPTEYLEFLESSDGGEGDVGERWVELWPVGRVLAELEGEPHYEGVVLFGGDGANTVFG